MPDEVKDVETPETETITKEGETPKPEGEEEKPAEEKTYGGFKTVEDLEAAYQEEKQELEDVHSILADRMEDDSTKKEEKDETPKSSPEEEEQIRRDFLAAFSKDPIGVMQGLIGSSIKKTVDPQIRRGEMSQEIAVARSKGGKGEEYEDIEKYLPEMTKLAGKYKEIMDGPDGLKIAYTLARAGYGRKAKKQKGLKVVGNVEQPETPVSGSVPKIGAGGDEKIPTPEEELRESTSYRRQKRDEKLGIKPAV